MANDEWGTPPEILDRARAALGGTIDVDPASNAVAQRVVQARTWYGPEDDGLTKPWNGTVWLNGPFSDLRPWISKLREEIDARRTRAAIVLVNCDPSTKWYKWALSMSSAKCDPFTRIKFLLDGELPKPRMVEQEDGTVKKVHRTNNKPQSLFYIGDWPTSFYEAFSDLGTVYAVSLQQRAAARAAAEVGR